MDKMIKGSAFKGDKVLKRILGINERPKSIKQPLMIRRNVDENIRTQNEITKEQFEKEYLS